MAELISGLVGLVIGALVASLARIAETVFIGSFEDRRRLRALLQRALVEVRRNRALIATEILGMEDPEYEEVGYRSLEKLFAMEKMISLDAWEELQRSPIPATKGVMRVLELGAEVSAFIRNVKEEARPPEKVPVLPPLEMVLADEAVRRTGRQPWSAEQKARWKASEPARQESLDRYQRLLHTDYLRLELRRMDDFVRALEDALVAAQPWLLRRRAKQEVQATLPMYQMPSIDDRRGEQTSVS
jgi:hypothetical protein